MSSSTVVIVIVVVLIAVIIIVEITPHSARNASEQGWLLRYKTVHCSLTHHLALCTAASLVMLPLSCSLVAPHPSCHAILSYRALCQVLSPCLSRSSNLVALCLTVDWWDNFVVCGFVPRTLLVTSIGNTDRHNHFYLQTGSKVLGIVTDSLYL